MQKSVKGISGYFFSLPVLAVLIVLTIYPTLYVIYMCFNEWDPTSRAVDFVGLRNFQILLASDQLPIVFRNTVTFASLAVVLEFVLGLGLALFFDRPMRGKSLIRTCLILPMATVPLVVTLIWRLILNPDFGILSQFLNIFGVGPINWLSWPNLALFTCVLVDVWQNTPFIFLILYAGLQSVPVEPYEAAVVDGASRVAIFRSITIPMLRPAITVAVLFRAVDAFRVFDLIFGLTYGGPGITTSTMSFRAYQLGWSYLQFGQSSVLTLIIMVIAMAISQVYLRLQREE
jgi:multiple sugar transport system permease protein